MTTQTYKDQQHLTRLHIPDVNTALPSGLQRIVHRVLTVLTPSLTARAAPKTALLLGPSGSGKSLVTNRVLSNLHNSLSPPPLVLHLHGLLHLTPQRAWRQLAASCDDEDSSSVGIADCLAALQPVLCNARKSTPVLFVVDAFDRFASDGQNVLYALLNVLQEKGLRAAMIAMTCRIDVTDALEKRVKSRFLHSAFAMPLPTDALEIARWVVSVLGDDDIVNGVVLHRDSVAAMDCALARCRVVTPLLRAVEAGVRAARRADAEAGRRVLRQLLVTNGGIHEGLKYLGALEMGLLMALRKLQHDTCRVVFTDVFAAYDKVTGGGLEGRVGERSIARGVAEKSWETLVEAGFVVRIGNGPRDMRPCYLAVDVKHVDEALKSSHLASTCLKNWAAMS